jgi:hypothetical protein
MLELCAPFSDGQHPHFAITKQLCELALNLVGKHFTHKE